jgi:hypothetical protein
MIGSQACVLGLLCSSDPCSKVLRGFVWLYLWLVPWLCRACGALQRATSTIQNSPQKPSQQDIILLVCKHAFNSCGSHSTIFVTITCHVNLVGVSFTAFAPLPQTKHVVYCAGVAAYINNTHIIRSAIKIPFVWCLFWLKQPTPLWVGAKRCFLPQTYTVLYRCRVYYTITPKSIPSEL